MKKQIWLVIFILVLMSVSLCAPAELGIDMETNMAYYGEWSKEGDTYFCKGPTPLVKKRRFSCALFCFLVQ